MDANKYIRIFGMIVLSVFAGCSKNETVRHGKMTYSISEIFPTGSHELALARAAGQGDVSRIKREIAAGANVNAVGKHGITPVWWAAWAQNYKGFIALLDAGADPNVEPSEQSPLMSIVCFIDESKFLEAALKHGGNPNLRPLQKSNFERLKRFSVKMCI